MCKMLFTASEKSERKAAFRQWFTSYASSVIMACAMKYWQPKTGIALMKATLRGLIYTLGCFHWSCTTNFSAVKIKDPYLILDAPENGK